jgi:hypothetical protein
MLGVTAGSERSRSRRADEAGALGEAMRARGRAVHEEAVIDDLVADLDDGK